MQGVGLELWGFGEFGVWGLGVCERGFGSTDDVRRPRKVFRAVPVRHRFRFSRTKRSLPSGLFGFRVCVRSDTPV